MNPELSPLGEILELGEAGSRRQPPGPRLGSRLCCDALGDGAPKWEDCAPPRDPCIDSAPAMSFYNGRIL